ncbi:hypothetical protein [Streptomyces sp. NPDC057002]|uniref:hypothetical protein n=1 Tax=Streptomyces sp. NPDC057002 TaxID=3345992 RepID=UPI003637FDE3
MPESRARMVYTDENGAKHQFYVSGIKRLQYVAENAKPGKPVGRFKHAVGSWKVHEVRAFDEAELWTVNWCEPYDDAREGAWAITGLTEKGRNVLAEWNRRKEQKENNA